MCFFSNLNEISDFNGTLIKDILMYLKKIMN